VRLFVDIGQLVYNEGFMCVWKSCLVVVAAALTVSVGAWLAFCLGRSASNPYLEERVCLRQPVVVTMEWVGADGVVATRNRWDLDGLTWRHRVEGSAGRGAEDRTGRLSPEKVRALATCLKDHDLRALLAYGVSRWQTVAGSRSVLPRSRYSIQYDREMVGLELYPYEEYMDLYGKNSFNYRFNRMFLEIESILDGLDQVERR
jgi:hypothetical protein